MTTSSTFTETFERIFKGEIEPPNLERINRMNAIEIIATYELRPTGVGHTKIDSSVCLARYFLEYTQAGTFSGNGYTAFSNSEHHGKFASFAICLHQKVLDPQANLLRGWAPAHCEKCGLDMTVDSGD